MITTKKERYEPTETLEVRETSDNPATTPHSNPTTTTRTNPAATSNLGLRATPPRSTRSAEALPAPALTPPVVALSATHTSDAPSQALSGLEAIRAQIGIDPQAAPLATAQRLTRRRWSTTCDTYQRGRHGEASPIATGVCS
jgi:hypothetical protein